MINETVRRMFKEAREQQGVSLKDVMHDTGISTFYIKMFENNEGLSLFSETGRSLMEWGFTRLGLPFSAFVYNSVFQEYVSEFAKVRRSSKITNGFISKALKLSTASLYTFEHSSELPLSGASAFLKLIDWGKETLNIDILDYKAEDELESKPCDDPKDIPEIVVEEIPCSPFPFPEEAFLVPKKPDMEARIKLINGRSAFAMRFNNDTCKRIGGTCVRIAAYNGVLYFVPVYTTEGNQTPEYGYYTFGDGRHLQITAPEVVDKLRDFSGAYDVDYDDEHNLYYTVSVGSKDI